MKKVIVVLILLGIAIVIATMLTSCTSQVEEVKEEVKENIVVVEVEKISLEEKDLEYLEQLDVIVQNTNSALQEIGSLIVVADVENKDWQEKVYNQMTLILIAREDIKSIEVPTKMDNIQIKFECALSNFVSATEYIDKAIDKSWDKKYQLENALYNIQRGREFIEEGNIELELLMSKVK